MTVYLLHFDRPYRHARHYVGWAKDLDARMEAHRAGRGARLMEVIKEAGIGFELARTWTGDRRYERRIKAQRNAPRLCPICHPPHGTPGPSPTPAPPPPPLIPDDYPF